MPKGGSENDSPASSPSDSSGELVNTFGGLRLPHEIVNRDGRDETLNRRIIIAFLSLAGTIEVTTTSGELNSKSEDG